MTLTIKDSLESTSQGKPGSSSQNPEQKPGTSPRSNPVCLEVPVTVRSLPGDDAPGSTGPIREEGRTVIVFDNGAVLRVSNNLPAGQKVIVSNARGNDVVCRVVSGRNLPTVKGYIEVEFLEQCNDFWRIHQSAEPVNVSAPPTPVSILPPPVPVPPPAMPDIAPLVAPRVAASEKETSSTLGSAPSFEDIAGLVNMSPRPADRKKANDTSAPVGAAKNKNDLGILQGEPTKIASPVIAPVPIADVIPIKRPVPQAQELSPLPVQRPAVTSEVVSLGMLSTGQMSASSSGDARSRMPIIAGGVIVILAGLGAGFFMLHRGTSPAREATVAAVQPVAPAPAPQTSEAQAVQTPPPGMKQPPSQPEPAATVAAATPEAAVSASTEVQNARRPANNKVAAKEPEQAPKQRPQLPNLKMAAPSVPSQNVAKLSNGSAPNVTDVSSPVAPGGASPAAMLSPLVRTENQPAPPPSPISSPPPAKVVREPRLISSTRPIYPAIARQASTQGTVMVSAEIDARGIVTAAKAISGPATLREAAIDAVKQWKYSPALIDGKPSTSQVTVDVQFRLN